MKTLRVLLTCFAFTFAIGASFAFHPKPFTDFTQNSNSAGGTTGCSTVSPTDIPLGCSTANTLSLCHVDDDPSGKYVFQGTACNAILKKNH